MRELRNLAVATLLLLAPAGASAQPAPTRRAEIRVENPTNVRRPDEVIAVPWADVVRGLGGTADGRAVRVKDVAGREVTSQLLDVEPDGRPDSLLILSTLSPNDIRLFTLENAAPAAKYAARVDVRHDPPRDDVAWESDRVGFRIYGEGLKKTPSAMSSSGIDVWQKRTRELIVEKWYAKGHDEYHLDKGEGADFFDVGTTLGAGGVALWVNDTIWRADNFKAHRIIADGPVRAIFELQYDPWTAPGLEVTETKRFIIDAGQNLYRQESVFRAKSGADVSYVVGVVKRPGMVATMSRNQPWAWLTGWGPTAPKNGGHGELGTAVMLPRDRALDWEEAHGHYLAVSRAKSGERVVHYIGAGWTAAGDFPTPQSWWKHLDELANRLAAPVKVTVTAK